MNVRTQRKSMEIYGLCVFSNACNYVYLCIVTALTLYYYGFEVLSEPGFLGPLSVYLVSLGGYINSLSARRGSIRMKYISYALGIIGVVMLALALLRRIGLL